MPKTFAPVFSHVDGDAWQVGLPRHGRAQVFSASQTDMVRQPKGWMYVEWLEDEELENRWQ